MEIIDELINENDEFEDILSKTGTLAYEKQLILTEMLEGQKGNLNLEKQVLEFDNYNFPIQIIGILSLNDNMWNWAWDNEGIGFDEELLKDAYQIKEIGEKYNIPEFKNNIISNIDIDSIHTLLMPVSTLTNANAYYGIQEENFIIFVNIHSDELPLSEDLASFAEFYNKFVKDFKLNPKMTLESYAKLKGYDYKDEIEFAVVKANQQRVIVGFSEQGKLTNIQTML